MATKRTEPIRVAKVVFEEAINEEIQRIKNIKNVDNDEYQNQMNNLRYSLRDKLKNTFDEPANVSLKSVVYNDQGELTDFFKAIKKSKMRKIAEDFDKELLASGDAVQYDTAAEVYHNRGTAEQDFGFEGEKKRRESIEYLDNLFPDSTEVHTDLSETADPPNPLDQAREETRRHLQGLEAIQRLKKEFIPGSRAKTRKYKGRYSKSGLSSLLEGGKRRTRKRRGRRKRGGKDVNKNELVEGGHYFWIRESPEGLENNWIIQGIFQGYKKSGDDEYFFAKFSHLAADNLITGGRHDRSITGNYEAIYEEPLSRIRHIFIGPTGDEDVNKLILEYAGIEKSEVKKGNTKGGRKTKRRRKKRKRKTRRKRRKRRRLNQVKKQIGCKKY